MSSPNFESCWGYVIKWRDFEDVGILVGFPGGAGGNESAYQYRKHKRPGFDPCIKKIPWRRSASLFLPGESDSQRGRVGELQSMGLKRVGHY